MRFTADRWLTLFRETENPIYAWRAFQDARRFGLPIPEDVLEYFDSAADGIVKAANNPPPPKDRPSAIAKALRLGKDGAGQGSPFKEYKGRQERRQLAIETYEKVQQFAGGGADYAYDEIAEKTGVSKSTIRRNFNTHLKVWKAKSAALVEAGLIDYDDQGKPRVRFAGDADDIRETAIILKLTAYDSFSRIQ